MLGAEDSRALIARRPDPALLAGVDGFPGAGRATTGVSAGAAAEGGFGLAAARLCGDPSCRGIEAVEAELARLEAAEPRRRIGCRSFSDAGVLRRASS